MISLSITRKSASYVFLPYAIALLCIAIAFAFQWPVVSAISMPVEEDLYRDLGSAQGFLQGLDTRDPQFADATRWYSPFGAFVVSVLSRITGVGLFDFYTHGGPFLNLLGPLLLLVWVSRMVSPWAGCFSVIAYVFMSSHADPSWYSPTYSPWLWAFNFSQGIAFAALSMLHQAVKTSARWPLVLSGLLLGVVFLSHAAPAAIIALCVLIFCFSLFLARTWTWQRAFMIVCINGGVSLAVAMLMLWPIIEAYHLKTLNPAPAKFVGMSLGETVSMLLHPKHLLAIPLVAWMMMSIRHHARENIGASLFLAFCASCAAWLAYGMFADMSRSKGWIDLPQFVPTFHFNLYLLIALNIGFGIGVFEVLKRVPAFSQRLPWVASVFAIALVGMALPDYRNNVDLHAFAKRAEGFAQRPDLKPLYDWCLQHTSTDDVFLADDFYGQYAIGAAARKVMVLDPLFTSPYLDFDQRAKDRRTLYRALEQADWATFDRLADRYRIRYVLIAPELRLGLYNSAPVSLSVRDTGALEQVASFGNVLVFRRPVKGEAHL